MIRLRIPRNDTKLQGKTDKEPFTKDFRLTPGEGGLRNSDVTLLFEYDSIVLSGRRGEGGLEILVLAGSLL